MIFIDLSIFFQLEFVRYIFVCFALAGISLCLKKLILGRGI